MFQRGNAVRHRGYGPGVVQGVVGDDLVNVYFDSIEHDKVVRAAELELGKASIPVSPSPLPKQPAKAPAPSDGYEGRKAVECLRQGIPPPNGLESWTIGMDDVRQKLGAALDDAARRHRGSAIVVEAPFGSGKSHVGRWAREIALKRGIAIMHVDLDGMGLSLTNPAVLTARLLASLELPDGNGGVREPPGLGTLLREAGTRLRGVTVRGLEHFEFFLKRWEAFDGDEEAVEILEGFLAGELAASASQTRLRARLADPALVVPALRMNYGSKDDRVVARVDEVLRLYQLADRCGATGILVLVDELDHDHGSGRWKSEAVRPGLETFRLLASKGPIVTLFLATPGIEELRGPSIREIHLPTFTESQLRGVFEKAVETYGAAEPRVASPGNLDRLFGQAWVLYTRRFQDKGWGPRFFVRVAIEACELARSRRIPVGELEF